MALPSTHYIPHTTFHTAMPSCLWHSYCHCFTYLRFVCLRSRHSQSEDTTFPLRLLMKYQHHHHSPFLLLLSLELTGAMSEITFVFCWLTTWFSVLISTSKLLILVSVSSRIQLTRDSFLVYYLFHVHILWAQF